MPSGEFGRRSLGHLLEEFTAVRRATITLFAGLPPEAWERLGTANGFLHSVLSLGYMIAGHELHHREILRTRYLGHPPRMGSPAAR